METHGPSGTHWLANLVKSVNSRLSDSHVSGTKGVVEEDSHGCTLGYTCIHTPVHLHTVTCTHNTFHLYMPVFLQTNEEAHGVTQPEPY